MLKKKHIATIATVILVGIVLLQAYKVNAVTYSSGNCYYFNRTTGAFAESQISADYGKDCMKQLDNQYAYCSQWKTHISNTTYTKDSSWNSNSRNAITMGYIIEEINKEKSGAEAYSLTAATLNTFNNRVLNDNQAYDFYTSNTEIKKYFDRVKDKYSENKVGAKTLPSLIYTTSSYVLNYTTGSTYISDKITLSKVNDTNALDAYYGNTTDTVTYTITPTITSGTVQICTNANGTGCQNSVTLTNRNTKYEFYVKATDINTTENEGISITIKTVGNNKTTYPTAERYASSSDSQKLIVLGSGSISRTTTKSLVLSVPDLTKHTITGFKVDDEGNDLTGAVLELYKDDATQASNKLATNINGRAKVSYTTPKVETGEDDFFNHNYYLVERSAPDGYILSSGINEIKIKGTDSNTTREVCYHNGGNDSSSATEVEKEHCNFDNYDYMCKNKLTNEIVPLNDQGTCSLADTTPTPSGETGTTTSEGEGTEGETPTGEGGSSISDCGDTEGEGCLPAQTPTVTYDTICVKKSEGNKEVESSYCTEKGNYILVKSANGNVTVTRSNSKNKVVISKKAATGDEEVPGATLKICDKTTYDAQKKSCTAAKTIDGVELSWTSGSQAQEWVGLKKGTYYIVETLPPAGYITAVTAKEFSIDEFGTVTAGNAKVESKDVKENPIVVRNGLNTVTISKDDIATSKELPGAKITICETYTDNDKKVHTRVDQYTGECITTRLTDGSLATWVSTDKPHEVVGLKAGTYALVERAAPDGYSTAESIIFTMKNDGTLTDANGKSLKESKIVMHDKKIEEVKTGMLGVYIISAIIVFAAIGGTGSYLLLKKSNSNAI